MRKIHLSQAIFLLIISSLSYADYEPIIGAITYTEGIVDISHKAEETSLLNEKDSVCVGDRIRTKTYSKAEITFSDKSILRLAPSTCVIIDEYKFEKNRRKQASIKLTRGKVQAIVSRTGAPETFIITTPNAVGKVKGSNIFMFYQAGRTGAFVKDGRMALSNISAPEEISDIKGGDSSSVSFSDIPSQSRPYFDAEIALHQKDVGHAVIKKGLQYEKAVQMTGVVTALSGEARIYKKGADDWRGVKLNETIAEGDKLQTADDGNIEIRFSNGNIVLLQPNTEFAITSLKYDPQTQEYENIFEANKGKIKAIVERQGEKSKFQVRTPTAICGVRGTTMYLNIQPNLTQSFYEGGGGIVTSVITSETKILDTGQNTVIDATGTIAPPVYTLNEQKVSMEGSWSKAQVMEGYYVPLGPATPEGHILPPLHPPMQEDSVQTADILLMEKHFERLSTFKEVFFPPPPDSSSTTTVANVIYTAPPLPIQLAASSGWFAGPGNAELDILDNGTWRGKITIGNFDLAPAAPWTLQYTNANNDVINITGTTAWSGGEWQGDIATGSIVRGTPIDKTLSGIADGTYSGEAPGTFNGVMSGSWVNQ